QNVGRPGLAGDRRHDHAIDAAWNDEVEPGEIGGDVEGEAMPGDPVARVHADGCDLSAARPHARVGGVSLAGNSIVSEGVDQRLFDFPEIPVQVLPMSLEIDDRVANELPGSMERHVTTALDLEYFDTLGAQVFRRGH